MKVILFIVVLLVLLPDHPSPMTLMALMMFLALIHHKSNYIWHPVLLRKAYRISTKTLKLA
jgi:hypothetical protein